MYRFLTKYGTGVAFGLGLLIAIIFFALVFGGLDDFNALAKEDKGQTSIFNVGLGAAILLVIICAILWVVFGLFHLITNPKGSLKFILGFVVLIGILLVMYSTADAEGTGKVAELLERYEITDNTSKFISGALWTVLILAGLAALSFVVSEVTNLLK